MKSKNLLFVLTLAVIVIFSCNNNSKKGNAKNDKTNIVKDTSETVTSEPETTEPEEVDSKGSALDKKLDEILTKNRELIFEQLNGLKKAIATQDEMKSLDEVEIALKMRDSLIYLLNNAEEFYVYMEQGDRFYEEFEAIGIQLVEAEGMFGNLDQAPIFENVIEKVADEPYVLFNKIKNLSASTHGSEYPYYDISEEMEIIPLAEKMLTKYPGHKYNEKIVEFLRYALQPLTDVHKVAGDYEQYIVGNYDVSIYPGATDIEFHNTFASDYSQSRFAKVVEKITTNISTLTASQFDKIYYVEVPDLKSDSIFADEKLNKQLKNTPKDIEKESDTFKYMWLGVDVPHQIVLRDGDDNKWVTIYRFYNTKEPAEAALKEIQKVIPKAKIVEYDLTEADKKHKN